MEQNDRMSQRKKQERSTFVVKDKGQPDPKIVKWFR